MRSDINEAGLLRAKRGQPSLRFGGWNNLPGISGTPPGKPCSFVLISFGKVDADCRVASLLANSVFLLALYIENCCFKSASLSELFRKLGYCERSVALLHYVSADGTICFNCLTGQLELLFVIRLPHSPAQLRPVSYRYIFVTYWALCH